jgi:hypothetical protein
MILKKRKLGVKGVAFSQIFIIVLGIIAFGFILSEVHVVSGQFPKTFLTGGVGGGSVAGPIEELPDIFKLGPRYQSSTLSSGSGTNGVFGSSGATNTAAKAASEKVAEPTWYGNILNPRSGPFGGQGATGTGLGSVFGPLIAGAGWGLIVGGITFMIASAVGADELQAEAIGYALGGGVAAGVAAFGYISEGGLIATTFGLDTSATFLATGGEAWFGTLSGAGVISLGIGLVVAAAILYATYKEQSIKQVSFQCLAWEAPLRGENCEECNKDPFRPCSEYRCRSLGQACELVNAGTVEEKCVWINSQDVNSPTIVPWDDVLLEDHEYTSHSQLPPSLGTQIVRSGGSCIKPFTPLVFGVINNEPARCKIDSEHRDTFDEMQFFFGDNNFLLNNHTQYMSLPSPDAINVEGPVIENDGIYDFFVRCQDANGNVNEQEFVFSFCVDPSPDTTPPIIVSTSIADKSPVSFGSDEVPFSLFVNEPVECKWSIEDKDFKSMENGMECATTIFEQNAQQLYECSTTLRGIKDREENDFFFRCKDQPKNPENERNVNVQSLEISLRGTQELNIISVKPDSNSTIFGSTGLVPVVLEIETSNGANEGESVCSFSTTGEEDSYILFFETNSFEHKQTLSLEQGDYEYFVRCIDAGGNSDETTIDFNVFIDETEPVVTRAYRELDALKIVTDEDAECAYSLNNCNFVFDEGIKMILSNPSIKTNHFSEWKPNVVYYIKCRDEFGNQPGSSECSLIGSATSII